jgi:hypothetical protein
MRDIAYGIGNPEPIHTSCNARRAARLGYVHESGMSIMAKAFHTNKQSKKLALLTPKEKKAKKLAKKHSADVVSIITT